MLEVKSLAWEQQFKDNSFIFEPGEYEKVKQYLENQAANAGSVVRDEVFPAVDQKGERVGGEKPTTSSPETGKSYRC